MKTFNNIVTEGLSGSMKQLVFRQMHGKTVVASRPRKRKGVMSTLQQQVQFTFKQAAIYARNILQDAAIYAEYLSKASPGVSPFNLAIADFFRVPVVGDIDSSNYTGAVGSTLSAVVMDDFRLIGVKARIQKANGELLEEGNAVLQQNGLNWLYTCTAANSSIEGSVITFTATDLPGHSIANRKTL